jgi:hypothetical protein
MRELEDGAQKDRIEFRRVYTTVLDRWLGLESEATLGARYTPLHVVRA